MLSIYLSVLDSDEDKSRFEVLYNLYRQSMYAIAYGILHNEFDAEDAVHESFLKIANHFEKIEEIKCPKTKAFIVIIVKNTSIDIYNRNKKTAENTIFIDDMCNRVIDEKAFEDIDYQLLLNKIDELPETFKDILYLRYVNGFFVEDTARLLNISVDAAYKRIQRAKIILSDKLKEESMI
ncbi:MAG: RNA polymerase sigma factor [Oscillospiraceae bacterium]|nr:RNA polymerase sigma factor [Oscillospiraceae bacterium]MBR2884429.1 RNA polymerase sigma factor [Clostridia bacterium]